MFCQVVDFLSLASTVDTIVDARVTSHARRKMLKAGVNDEEVDVVSYLPHTITVEPFEEYDYEYYHLDVLRKGVYYLVSPKVAINKSTQQINSPLTWTIDQDALAKCDFGQNNSRMATFLQTFIDGRKQFFDQQGTSTGMDICFGRFFEDDHPLMLIGPMSSMNKDAIGMALQVLPHFWIHGLFWRGQCNRPVVADDYQREVVHDFYCVVMEEDDSSSNNESPDTGNHS